MLPIDTIQKDVLDFLNETTESPEAIVCMGDTLTHFSGDEEVERIIKRISQLLPKGGKLVVSWRDLGAERRGADRFLLVRSDDSRIMSCFLEYFHDRVIVHDILLEKIAGQWQQSVSSYPKLRIPVFAFRETLRQNAFTIATEEVIHGMNIIIARKD